MGFGIWDLGFGILDIGLGFRIGIWEWDFGSGRGLRSDLSLRSTMTRAPREARGPALRKRTVTPLLAGRCADSRYSRHSRHSRVSRCPGRAPDPVTPVTPVAPVALPIPSLPSPVHSVFAPLRGTKVTGAGPRLRGAVASRDARAGRPAARARRRLSEASGRGVARSRALAESEGRANVVRDQLLARARSPEGARRRTPRPSLTRAIATGRSRRSRDDPDRVDVPHARRDHSRDARSNRRAEGAKGDYSTDSTSPPRKVMATFPRPGAQMMPR